MIEKGKSTGISAHSIENKADIIVRKSRVEDAEKLNELARLCFDPPEIAFTKKNFENMITRFPEGQICVEYKGKIIGSCSSLIVNIDEYPKHHTLHEISDQGYISNHNENGKDLYGIDVIVHPDYRGLKIGKQLYEARKQVCKELHLQSIIFGGRIPNFCSYASSMSAKQYVENVMEGKIYDPVLTFQLRNGFTFKYILPNYIPEDRESLCNATFMEWRNTEQGE
ncbi:GNAT family N-acetyltransferase [Alteribacillus sp. YIM 98480]|uniref:GNAT family N-acetyltransferase n=1 Tax=Alteribacillus sp. YIM 98480 TaxID=2606599 RepID=UPI001E366198|nr:GNAT family N-acetyltransferase [Alteribacillus sp. YIM 98480]